GHAVHARHIVDRKVRRADLAARDRRAERARATGAFHVGAHRGRPARRRARLHGAGRREGHRPGRALREETLIHLDVQTTRTAHTCLVGVPSGRIVIPTLLRHWIGAKATSGYASTASTSRTGATLSSSSKPPGKNTPFRYTLIAVHDPPRLAFGFGGTERP